MRRLLLIAMLLLPPLGAFEQRSSTPRIWFSSLDPYFRKRAFQLGPTDFMDLFHPGAPWNSAAARVSVFKVGKDYVKAASDSELRTVIGWLRQNRIAFAMQGPMFASTETCGRVEGYGSQIGSSQRRCAL